MKQTRWMSMVEAITNVVVGYSVAVIAQIMVFPWFGFYASLRDNLVIGGLFSAISILRSYILRRTFEAIRFRQVQT